MEFFEDVGFDALEGFGACRESLGFGFAFLEIILPGGLPVGFYHKALGDVVLVFHIYSEIQAMLGGGAFFGIFSYRAQKDIILLKPCVEREGYHFITSKIIVVLL